MRNDEHGGRARKDPTRSVPERRGEIYLVNVTVPTPAKTAARAHEYLPVDRKTDGAAVA